MSTIADVDPVWQAESVNEPTPDVLALADPGTQARQDAAQQLLRRRRMTAWTLGARDLGRLARTAQATGFAVTRLPNGALRMKSTASSEPGLLARTTPAGLRLVGEESALRRLVAADNVALATQYLKETRGLQVKVARTPSGEVRLTADEGTRRIEVDVRSDGRARVDLSGFKGRECEPVMRDVATALQGQIANYKPKPELFQPVPVTVGTKA